MIHTLASNPVNNKGHNKLLALIASTLLLSACGGGGSSEFTDLQDSVGQTAPGQGGNESLSIGSGSGDNFTEGQLTANEMTLEAGESTKILINVVNQDNEPPSSEYAINVTSACVAGGLASLTDPVEITPGYFNIDYTAQGCSGADTVTARIEGTSLSATVGLTVVPPEVLTVSFVGSTLTQLALAGIGGDESTEVTFRLAGPQGVAIIGEEVSFSINSSVGGASILAGRESGTTDSNGEVRTILKSGTVAGPVKVRASYNATGLQGASDDIIISTGLPEYSRFSLTYGNFNPSDAFDTDGVSVNLNIIASDQFGNNPLDGTRVSFVAPESGNVLNSCELIDGICGVSWRSSSPRPANGRLEIIAYTDGAEDFIDNNGNSVYDAGDGGFTDLSEPYADENENGTYDLGEFFFDSNQNGVWDSGNGEWDGPCLSLVDTSAICNGESSVSIFNTVTVVMSTNTPRLLATGTFGLPGSTITIPAAGTTNISGIILADNNTNAVFLGSNPMPFGTNIAFSIVGDGVSLVGASSFSVPNTTGPTGPYGVNLKPEPGATGTPQLLMTVTPPNAAPTEYLWDISIL